MMNRKQVFPFFLFLLCTIHSQMMAGPDGKYPFSEIPDALISNSKAVVRSEEIFFELRGIKDATTTIKYAITILNRDGLQLSYFVKGYDQFTKIRKIDGTVFDKDGDKVRTFRSEDIHDYSANSGGNLYIDARMKIIDPEYVKYPFTVEYSCEIVHKGLLNYPDWEPFRGYGVAVEKSSFTAIVPAELDLRYYEQNIKNTCDVSAAEGSKQYLWLIENQPSFEDEYYSPPFESVSPTVYLAPSQFSIDGVEGSCESWKSFGQWINKLNEGQDELSDETKLVIAEITSDAADDLEKSEILYHHMQDKCRYVSVQVGIGSWQPTDAQTVDELSYGDCKALTNYMKSLLDVAGVDSYYTLVKAGSDAADIKPDFPSNQFNHAILCIPSQQDTIWLECTSQRMPFGYIGTFTDNRHVIIVNDDGGVLAKTKTYTHTENLKTCKARIEIDSDGSVHSSVRSEYKGIYLGGKLPLMHKSEHDMKKKVEEGLDIPSFVLHDVTYTAQDGLDPSIIENIEVESPKYALTMGNRMFINVNYFNKLQSLPSKNDERGSDIFIRHSTVEVDTLIYNMPAEYSVENSSANREINTEFGDFKTSVTFDESQIIFTRYLKMNSGNYAPSSYGSFVSFLGEISNADEDRVVLKK